LRSKFLIYFHSTEKSQQFANETQKVCGCMYHYVIYD